jgi:DNA modification methylase
VYLLVQGNAKRIPLASNSVHCVVTSIPYWGLRAYLPEGHPNKHLELGHEESPDAFVETMVSVFSEVKRVLHPSGTLWLNIGDSYCNAGTRNNGSGLDGKRRGGMGDTDGSWADSTDSYGDIRHRLKKHGIKHKDLLMIPARVAIALQADGWWLRQKIVWAKTSPMPEPVTDRPVSATEEIFLLTKSKNYFYDVDAVRVPSAKATIERDKSTRITKGKDGPYAVQHDHETESHPLGRNLWNYWVISAENYGGGHYATFPRKLVEPCIKAGTSEKGCCPVCGAGWVRVVERANNGTRQPGISRALAMGHSSYGMTAMMRAGEARTATTVGWHPDCSHDVAPVPCVVLDPFVGSGTTIVVANALGRHGIGLDLNEEYLTRDARRRIDHPHAPIQRPGKQEHHPLFGESA